MSRRQHCRRQQREAERRCLTVSDIYLINENRRLPVDHPSLGLRKRKDRPKSPRLVFPRTTRPEQAWRYVKVINRSEAARRACEWMRNHPGPQSSCPPELYFVGMCLAAEETGWYLRSDICSIINGLDASILHYFGVCDNKGFKPISYSAVQRQAFRFEHIPFEELMAGIIPEYPLHDPDDAEDDDEAGADLGLLWFNLDILLATIPPKALSKIRAGAVDATAFPTYARTHDFRVQKDVNKAVLEALKEKGTIPEDVTLGSDGKLIRCPHDPDARGSRRSPSLATGHKAGNFAGYAPTILTPSRDYEWTGDPQQIRLRDHISPYVLAFSVDPATRKKGPIARDLALALKHVLPGFRALTGDREFTEQRESMVRPLHANGISVVMDRKSDAKHADVVTVGQRQESLYQICGGFYPMWVPERFLEPPDDSLTEEEVFEWHQALARFRYSTNGPSTNGTIQFLCPQCAGRVIYAKKARTGKYKRGNYPASAISYVDPDRDWVQPEYCCNGAISIHVEDLDWWQPVPWGTRAHDTLYNRGRTRIENINNLLRDDEGMNPKACRASGTVAHNMAVLALTIVNNVQLADADPLADPSRDDKPKVELSLFCVQPADSDEDDLEGHSAAAPSPGDSQDGSPPRAPP